MFGGQNMQQMMKQAKKMQQQMADEQAAIAKTDYIGHAPFNGDRELKDLQINEDIVDPEDVDGLSDMVIVAVNDALKQIEQDQQKRLGQFAPKGMF